jgi:multisubunit Na+/H+ antiporter MnhE subunit
VCRIEAAGKLPNVPRSNAGNVLGWAAAWAVLFVFWLLYVDRLQTAEVVVGAVVAALATAAAVAVRGQALGLFHPYARWFFLLLRVPWLLVNGTAVLAWLLIGRHLLGREMQAVIKAVPFEAGEKSNARDAARRALAITLTTFPPNFVVIDIDVERKRMLVHQVIPTDVPGVAKVLGAKSS